MLNMEKVYEFAIKWYDKLCDETTDYLELVDHWMADDCEALGFKMDCGESFERIYGRAIYDYEALEEIINRVTDISLLGSAIYSRWRYFNHWAYSAEEITNPNNRKWFITAFNRMAQLSKERNG